MPESDAAVRVHFWSGGACRTAQIKDVAPIPGGPHLLTVQLPNEDVDVWSDHDEDRSENSWHRAH